MLTDNEAGVLSCLRRSAAATAALLPPLQAPLVDSDSRGGHAGGVHLPDTLSQRRLRPPVPEVQAPQLKGVSLKGVPADASRPDPDGLGRLGEPDGIDQPGESEGFDWDPEDADSCDEDAFGSLLMRPSPAAAGADVPWQQVPLPSRAALQRWAEPRERRL